MEGYPILFHSQPNNIDMMSNSHLFGHLLASRNDSSSSALLVQGSKDEASTSQGNHQEGVMASTNGEVGTGEKASKKKGEKKVKRPRYAFQTRSQVDILDDGYRWRKYGQKAVKNNKFPRSYYRCTHHGCNVKKQVQRLSKDEGVVVTTYEGMHTHPIEKSNDNFEHILKQMQIYSTFCVQDKLEVN